MARRTPKTWVRNNRSNERPSSFLSSLCLFLLTCTSLGLPPFLSLPFSILQKTASSAHFTSSLVTLPATPDRHQRQRLGPCSKEPITFPIINIGLPAECRNSIIITHGASIPTLPSVVKYPRRFPAPSQYLQTSIGLSTTKTVLAGFYQAKRAQVKTKDRPRKSSFNIEEIIFFEGKILW